MALRILILSRTPIGRRMSSPGIRYVNLTRVLRAALPDATVTLASPPVAPEEALPDLDVVTYRARDLLPLVRRHDVVISMSFPLPLVLASPFLRRTLLVLDFFSQFYVEWMETGRDLYRGLHRRLWTRASQAYANLQLRVADYVLCANERQRDGYVGVLGSLGRLTPRVYDEDPTLRRLIDVAPHGVRPEPPPQRRRLRPDAVPGIEPDDKLVLWLGGVLYWYDPVTLIRAVSRLRQEHPEVKLLFRGSVYPGGSILGLGLRYREAVIEARRQGQIGTGVFFEEQWLPQEEVVEYLAAADAGVATYFTNAETRYAHRTRFLDYIWAGTPIVCTEGDILAEEVAAKGWGIAVPERDEDALVAALTRVLYDEAFIRRCRTNLTKARSELTWEAAFAPLVSYLESPRRLGEGRSARVLSILRSAAAYGLGRGLEKLAARVQHRLGR
jgi:glycosyltransferase involved in cell wall biosynthesis